MTQIYNFSAGPAVLPKDVLTQVQAELLDWHGSGMSVMEMSHRGKEFMSIAAEAEADLAAGGGGRLPQALGRAGRDVPRARRSGARVPARVPTRCR